MFTATGFMVMWVAAVSTCTAKAVESPPRPCGPTPSMLTARVNSVSSFAPSGSSQCEPSARVAACLARCTHRSEVPPIAKTLPVFENTGWFGIVAPTGTPKEIVEKIYLDTRKALDDSRMKARFWAQGLATVGNSPEEMGRAMKEETELWARVVKERNIRVK